MNWLSRYYDRRVGRHSACDFLAQVGHTENGQPISDAQFDAMLQRIRTALDLKPNDVLLDLCCGNGILTQRLASDVSRVVGIDFSHALIELAKAHHFSTNVIYFDDDVKHLSRLAQFGNAKFSKVVMNAALQHFSPNDFRVLLRRLKKVVTNDRRMLFAFVPDADKKATFDAKLKPGLDLRWRRLVGRDLMGTWWHHAEIAAACRDHGFEAEFLDVDPSLDGARYRFDVRVS